MPEKYTYLLVDVFCILFPFLFSFHPKIRFDKQWKYLAIPLISTSVFFVAWDMYFIRAGIWSFNPKYVCGIFLLSLPLEEYLFFLCIPYACVFTYYCMTLFVDVQKYNGAARMLSVALAIALMTVAALHLHALYTSVTFLLMAVVLLSLVALRASFLAAFYLSFAIILIPFFISNGLLTGTGLAEPVVSYDNDYNLGIRMLTIPFEDTFYGMLLLLINLSGFEYMKNKSFAAAERSN